MTVEGDEVSNRVESKRVPSIVRRIQEPSCIACDTWSRSSRRCFSPANKKYLLRVSQTARGVAACALATRTHSVVSYRNSCDTKVASHGSVCIWRKPVSGVS